MKRQLLPLGVLFVDVAAALLAWPHLPERAPQFRACDGAEAWPEQETSSPRSKIYFWKMKGQDHASW